MSKSAKLANNDHVTPELLALVVQVLKDKSQNRYSTSLIYNTSNQVFKLDEKPESCASCLRTRASNLERWYEAYQLEAQDEAVADGGFKEATATVEKKPKEAKAAIGQADTSAKGTPTIEAGHEGKDGVIYATEEEALATLQDDDAPTATEVTNKAGEKLKLVFLSEDGDTGTVTLEGGASVKAGTYTLENGDTIAVQPGGKANYKSKLN